MTGTYTDEYITLNDCKLHYQAWGDPNSPPLLMVHGITRESHDFDRLAERLQEKFRCLSLDIRGRGESQWADPATYSYGYYAKDIMAFLEALGLDRVHYLGTSMGGQLAMMLAARHPEIFRGIVINDIAPETPISGLNRVESNVAGAVATFPSLDAFIDAQWNQFPWTRKKPREELAERSPWAVRQGEDGTWSVKHDPAIIGGGLVGPEQRKKADDILWRGFRGLTCPILLIWGDQSEFLTGELVEAMKAAQPAMKVARVPGVGHAPYLTEPEAVEAIEAFFG